ncbi:MAG TPA: two-component regulator propeller domain-containing protein [Bryobacteraceae bacterium]|nr:two-component regulator propeller domain-containing protein [Bryobacteraceae bacterium]
MKSRLRIHDKPRLRAMSVCGFALLTVVAPRGLALDPTQQASTYLRRNFTVEDGLPANEVNSIVQTRNGFLWVATDGGLARFDGEHFTPIRFRAGVSKEVPARALLAAPDGTLWVGTDNGVARIPSAALDHFDRTLVDIYHPGPGRSDQVLHLHLSRAGVLWVATFAGLYRFDSGKFVSVIPGEMISRIEEASNGNLLIITGHGFVEWDGSRIITHPQLAPELGVATDQIFHVFEDRSGTTWYCTSAGVARRRNGSIEKLAPWALPGSGAWRVYVDPQGNVWVHGDRGLSRATASGLQLQRLDLRPTFTYSDADGHLWIAAGNEGLVRLKEPTIRMYGTADGLPNEVVMAVLSDHNGTLWAGSNCGGLSRFDGSRFQTYNEKDGLSNSCVWALAEDDNHDLWIGTWGGGLYRFRDGRFTQYSTQEGLPNSIVLSIAAARDGSLWIATGSGLSRMQNGNFRNYTTADGLSSDRVITAYQDRNGVIWAGTSAGVDRLEGARFVPLREAEAGEIPYAPIREDSQGNLYALSAVNGISRVEGSRLVNVYQGIQPSGMAESIGHNLWFSAKQGIFRVAAGALRRAEQDRHSPLDYRRFGRHDGLISRESSGGQPNITTTPDGKLWVATIKGLAMLDLGRLPHADRKPGIFMEDVYIGRAKLTPQRELVLRPGSSHIKLHFTAVDLASPENIRLQYRLDGVDPGWLDADSNRQAIYTEIPVGVHSFHIRACNREGIWDREGVVYTITQQPYFYQTTLFRLTSVSVGLLLLVGLYRFRLRQAAARLSARLEERAAERERIARELHDTLLQSFHGLLLRFQAAHNLLPGRAADARQVLATALDDAAQAITEARDAVQDLRASTGVTNELAKSVKAFGDDLVAQQRAANGHATAFSVEVEGTPQDLHPILRDEIYRIAGEALRNAFHHARAQRIEAEIRYDARQFRVRVRDDGTGIDAGVLRQGGRPGHWGLKGMRERAKRIGGQLELWSEHGAGTEVELTVPSSIAYRNHAGRL